MTVNSSLSKNPSNKLMITVDEGGKSATTIFFRDRVFGTATLANIELITGRTHQIRVHSASIGHPVLGDKKYGDRILNREFKKTGLKRMFLHAESLSFKSPVTQKNISVEAALEDNLISFLEKLNVKNGYY